MDTGMTIQDPNVVAHWNDRLAGNHRFNVFYTANWANVIRRSYRYKPCYFSIYHNDAFEALIPIMEIKSCISGRRGISLPFTDLSPPVVPDQKAFQTLFSSVIEFGKQRKWKFIELRCYDLMDGQIPTVDRYLGHTIALHSDPNIVFKRLRSSTKRNIRKARMSDVDVQLSNCLQSVNHYYHLNCITRKRHGLPPQPYYFFKRMHEEIFSKGMGFVSLASHKDQPIAAAVYLIFNKTAVYKYGASDMRFQKLRANNLVMWEAIRYCCQSGVQNFDMGRTTPDNTGLIQFKRGWGATEREINYYQFDLKREEFLSRGSSNFDFADSIFRRMPIVVLKLLGRLAYRHVG